MSPFVLFSFVCFPCLFSLVFCLSQFKYHPYLFVCSLSEIIVLQISSKCETCRHIRKRGRNKITAKKSRKKKDAEIGKNNKLQLQEEIKTQMPDIQAICDYFTDFKSLLCKSFNFFFVSWKFFLPPWLKMFAY